MRKDLEAKIYIKDRLGKSKNPAVLCSFGKDSMVLLHLVRQIRPELPVVFLREPFFPLKNKFANRIIEEWSLTVYDFPPVYTGHIARGEEFEIVNWYNAYRGAYLYLPTGTHKRQDGMPYLCAVKDFIGRPKVSKYTFPWDTIFVGHKNGDTDAILGETRLTERTPKLKEMTLALPIMEWSDADVWAYIRENKIPYNENRYNAADDFREFADKTYSNDFYPCCFDCLAAAGEVVCPRSGQKMRGQGQTAGANAEKRADVLAVAGYVKAE